MLYFKSQIHLNLLDSKDVGQLKVRQTHVQHTHIYHSVKIVKLGQFFSLTVGKPKLMHILLTSKQPGRNSF